MPLSVKEKDALKKVFKAYDIRGVYPVEIDAERAEWIGLAIGAGIRGTTIAVGRDMRLGSPPIAAALIRGLTRAGKAVVNLGCVTTPMVTFAVARFGYDGGVQVTASHNPPQDIGFKICRADAEPVSYETGIHEIERRVLEGDLPVAASPGSVAERDVLPEYLDHLMTAAQGIRGLKVVVDAGNGMAGYLVPPLFERLDVELVPLYFDLNGRFPNHEANPLKPENLLDLQAKVRGVGAHVGVAFDADGDRVAFVDERGKPISCDLITALIAQEILAGEPGATILYDLRSSWAVPEMIGKWGGNPVRTRVGHSYIKAAMREHHAAFGGELSGHYYFRDNYYCDSGAFALLKVLSLLCRAGKPVSRLVRPLRRYCHSGEINFDVEDKEGKLKALARAYRGGRPDDLDGLTVEFDDWWFNVRPSNTEPKLRLVVEAKAREPMEDRRDDLADLMRWPCTSGEVDATVRHPARKIQQLAETYACGNVTCGRGLRVEFLDWAFRVRPVGAEPKLRLVVGAKSRERMKAMRDHLLRLIRRP
jgi:phosphomannomutase